MRDALCGCALRTPLGVVYEARCAALDRNTSKMTAPSIHEDDEEEPEEEELINIHKEVANT